MKYQFRLMNACLFCLFCFFCIPFQSQAAQSTTVGILLRLETTGLNNVLIKGKVSGNFSRADLVTYLDFTFINQDTLAQFEFSGNGGFASLAQQPKRLRKITRENFRLASMSYLDSTRSLGITDGATLVGSFVSKSKKTRGICSAFGAVYPDAVIPLGEYQVTVVGTKINGDEVLNLTGTVTVSDLKFE